MTNLFKLAHDQELSALEKRAPRTATAIRACEAADEHLAAALLMGAAEKGRSREDVFDRLKSAESACWDAAAKPNVLLLISELCD
jgi:hypothetical protein